MEPIISSLLDTDFYKFTMGQVVFLKCPGIRVKYRLTCRTKDAKLAKVIDLGRLREELDHVRGLRFGNSELHYLRGTNEYQERMFREPYLEFLRNFRLPEYHLEERDGDLILEFSAPWAEAIYWEVPALAIVNELYYEAKMSPLTNFERDLVYAEGQRRLAEKLAMFRTRPKMSFVDFGTRRRFSRTWQRYVVKVFMEELGGQFRGTSNVEISKDFNTEPRGTDAHERAMVLGGLAHAGGFEAFVASQKRVLADWEETYGLGLSIALPDTFGSQFFYDHVMSLEQAQTWKGVRQDSGYPKLFFTRTQAFYERCGITPEVMKTKLFIPSDGLTVPRMLEVHDFVGGRMFDTYGYGTDAMNDLGLSPISIVIKPVEADGVGLVKLSDNPAKAIGERADIEAVKRLIGYNPNEYEVCVY